MLIRTYTGVSLDGFMAAPDGSPAWDAMPGFTPGAAPRASLRLDRHRAFPDGAVELAYSPAGGVA